jgi:hypothetical protein
VRQIRSLGAEAASAAAAVAAVAAGDQHIAVPRGRRAAIVAHRMQATRAAMDATVVSPIQDIPPVSTTTAMGIRAAGAAVDPGKSTAADSTATLAATAELSKWPRDCFDVLCRYAQRVF